MTLGLLYWILMLFWLVFGFWWHWPVTSPNSWRPLGNSLLLFVLLLILGWATFGAPIR
jgi:hypothetical protein